MAFPSKTYAKFVARFISRNLPKSTDDSLIEKSETPFYEAGHSFHRRHFPTIWSPAELRKPKMSRTSLCGQPRSFRNSRASSPFGSSRSLVPGILASQTIGLGDTFCGTRRYLSSASFHFPQLGLATQPNLGKTE
jgi:hypothetical protein